jgi:hypothetical protein
MDNFLSVTRTQVKVDREKSALFRERERNYARDTCEQFCMKNEINSNRRVRIDGTRCDKSKWCPTLCGT